jgi:hypothetical protein
VQLLVGVPDPVTIGALNVTGMEPPVVETAEGAAGQLICRVVVGALLLPPHA